MTKTEILKLIRTVYGAFNQIVHKSDEPFFIEAWHALLGEFTYEEAFSNAMAVASISKVMPTPGGIRRYIIDSSVGERPPTAQEAWAWLQQRNQEMNSGTWSQQDPHPVIVETMRALGTAVTGLHTNGDREYFSDVYNSKLQKYEVSRYKVNNEAQHRPTTR